ncbi:hypothetical protein M9458_026596, partial [Cirrhinus mrigala]
MFQSCRPCLSSQVIIIRSSPGNLQQEIKYRCLFIFILKFKSHPIHLPQPDSPLLNIYSAKPGPMTYHSMSTTDPFQELVDSLKKVLLRAPVIPALVSPSESSPAPSTSSSPLPSSPMARPVPYSGRVEECNGFLLQCSLVFTMQPALYPTDQSQIAFIISLLTGPALQWAETLWLQEGPATRSIRAFTAHFKEVFGQSDSDITAGEQLYHLKQGTMSIQEYSLKFRTLAAASGWNERSLLTTYRLGLEPKLRLQLAAHDDHQGLESFIQHSIRCSDCMSSYHTETTATIPALHQCKNNYSHLFCFSLRSPRLRVSWQFHIGCPLPPTQTPYNHHVKQISDPLQRELLSRRQVQHKCEDITLQLGLFHTENIQLLVLEGATVDIILGCPWLVKHDPILSWGTGEILRWGKGCFPNCFPDLPRPIQKPIPVCVTSVESPVANQSVKIPSIYSEFSDVFCPKRASQLPPHRPWDCAIDLVPDAPLPKGKIYPLSLPESKAMEEYIKEALSQGYIRPSTSPAASSFFFVSKKDGGLRPCIDYRAINRYTVKFRYPLPFVPAALEQLRTARIFTKLDLRSAYSLIWIREGDEWKTAFVTPTGHYEYLVMSYGLVNAPSVFQNFIHEVLREFLHRFVIVYIDDILIYSRSEAEHRHHVAEVLQKLREHQLYLKAEKCSFHQPSIHFLGYIIDRHGVRMDEGKVEAVISWPEPKTIKELQRFLGFANFYRRFIKGYSQISSSITNLLKGHPKTLTWTPDASKAFKNLKKAFTQAPLLTHPDPDLPFVVEVDASTTGHHGTPARLHPCAYFSRKLSPAEVNYDIGNRELLAIKLALEDYTSIPGVHRSQKLTIPPRCQAALSTLNFTISYRPGSRNIRADALSRLSEPEDTTGRSHPFYSRFSGTLSLLSERFWWPDMARDVRRYVRGCKECAMSKSPRHLPAGKLHPLPIPDHPWSHLGVDFMMDLPSSDGNTCILVIVDRFSKFCRLLPLKGLPTAMETAESLFNHVFRYYGIPEDTVSDRGPQFISRVWKSFFKLLGVTVSLSSRYHPQTNGQTERKIQEVGRFLRTFCHGHQNSWNQFLGWAEYAQNSLWQPSTGLTPFQCVLGFQSPLFPWNGEPSDVPTVDHWFRESERVWDNAHHHLQTAVRRTKVVADQRRITGPTFTPGQKVWLSTRDIRLRLPSKKLSPRFFGPFTILEQVNPVTFKLQLPPHYKIHPTFHVSPLKPCYDPLLPSTEPGHEEELPPPMVLEEGSIYSVKEILRSRRRGGRLEYLVDWEGFGPKERSWVPRDDILDPTLTDEFHAAHPYPAPRGR